MEAPTPFVFSWVQILDVLSQRKKAVLIAAVVNLVIPFILMQLNVFPKYFNSIYFTSNFLPTFQPNEAKDFDTFISEIQYNPMFRVELMKIIRVSKLPYNKDPFLVEPVRIGRKDAIHFDYYSNHELEEAEIGSIVQLMNRYADTIISKEKPPRSKKENLLNSTRPVLGVIEKKLSQKITEIIRSKATHDEQAVAFIHKNLGVSGLQAIKQLKKGDPKFTKNEDVLTFRDEYSIALVEVMDHLGLESSKKTRILQDFAALTAKSLFNTQRLLDQYHIIHNSYVGVLDNEGKFVKEMETQPEASQPGDPAAVPAISADQPLYEKHPKVIGFMSYMNPSMVLKVIFSWFLIFFSLSLIAIIGTQLKGEITQLAKRRA